MSNKHPKKTRSAPSKLDLTTLEEIRGKIVCNFNMFINANTYRRFSITGISFRVDNIRYAKRLLKRK